MTRLQSLPGVARWATSLALVALVSVLDEVMPSEISFSIFYLAPVSFAAAFVSRRAGLLLALLSAATWGYLELGGDRSYAAGWIVVWNGAVRLGFFVLVTELIVRLRRAHLAQRALARRDSLTGIANARVFAAEVTRTIAESRRSGRPFTVAYVDFDRFKEVNDRWGHAEGDRLLKAAAELMVAGVRSTDVVARLGGDEFAILMPDTGAELARTSLARVTTMLDEGVGGPWSVGVTVGAVAFAGPPVDADAAVRAADTLMYQAKDAGRGRILVATWPPVVGDEPAPPAVETMET